MAERVIDYDRGVSIRTHLGSNMDVFMYHDKPGEYLSAFGKPLPEQIAKEAGFDTVKLGKERVKRERMAKAMEAIEIELAEAGEVGEVAYEVGGFKAIHVGLGNHYVEDPDGNRLVATPIPEAQAKLLIDKLAQKEKK